MIGWGRNRVGEAVVFAVEPKVVAWWGWRRQPGHAEKSENEDHSRIVKELARAGSLSH